MGPTGLLAPQWVRILAIAAAVVLAAGLVVLAVLGSSGRDRSTVAAPSTAAPSTTAFSTVESPSGVGTQGTVVPAAAVSRRSSGLTARYIPGETWAGGYEASIAIATMVPIDGWSAMLTLPDGVVVTMAWDADFRQDGRNLTLMPKPWNDSITRGQSITVRFRVTGTGQPTACSVNGVTCAK